MNEAVLEQTPANFIIEEITDEAWFVRFQARFCGQHTKSPTRWVRAGWMRRWPSGIGKTPWRMFTWGYLDGKPVATNMLFNSGGVASIYAVATLPSGARQRDRRGITLKPLLMAREMGFRHAVLFSTEMGVRVYERIGFKLTPSVRINRYLVAQSGLNSSL
jgi:hypothetical protein